MKKIRLLQLITGICLILVCNTNLYARNLESLIDELESQLMPIDIENDRNPETSPNTIYSGTTKVSGTPKNVKLYDQIENALNAIDREIDQLDLRVALEKERMERNSRLKSFVKIAIILPGDTEIRDLSISINDQKLFYSELIQPISDVPYTLPILDGPMAPGKYRFDIKANISSSSRGEVMKKWQILQESKRVTLMNNMKKEAWTFHMKKHPSRNEYHVTLKTEKITLPNGQAISAR